MDRLNSMNGWASNGKYFTKRSAQSYLKQNEPMFTSSGVASGCGSSDEKPQPSACCAGDSDPAPQPSACGAGDDSKSKPSAGGSSCGSDGK